MGGGDAPYVDENGKWRTWLGNDFSDLPREVSNKKEELIKLLKAKKTKKVKRQKR